MWVQGPTTKRVGDGVAHPVRRAESCPPDLPRLMGTREAGRDPEDPGWGGAAPRQGRWCLRAGCAAVGKKDGPTPRHLAERGVGGRAECAPRSGADSQAPGCRSPGRVEGVDSEMWLGVPVPPGGSAGGMQRQEVRHTGAERRESGKRPEQQVPGMPERVWFSPSRRRTVCTAPGGAGQCGNPHEWGIHARIWPRMTLWTSPRDKVPIHALIGLLDPLPGCGNRPPVTRAFTPASKDLWTTCGEAK